MVTDSVSIYVGYSNTLDIPGAKGTAKLTTKTNADSLIMPAVISLYDRVVNPLYPVRRINITVNRVSEDNGAEQLSMLENNAETAKNKAIQETVLEIKAKYGKNAIL